MVLTLKSMFLFFIGWSSTLALMHWRFSKISDFRWKAWCLRAEYVLAIESILGVVSYFLWKTLSPLPHLLLVQRQKSTPNSPSFTSKSKHHNKNSEKSTHGCVEVQKNWIVWHYILIVVLVLGHLSYFTNLFLIGTDPHWFSMLCYICLGIQVQSAVCLLAITCLSFLITIANRTVFSTVCFSKVDAFLSKKNRAVIIIFYVLCASMVGLYTASQPPLVKNITIPIRDLPEQLRGLRIVQLSDIHLGPTVGYSKLKMIFGIVELEKPDILVITGDLVDGSVAALRGAAEPLTAVSPKYGKLYVSGNHEYYTGDVDNWFEFMRSLSFNVLHNSNIKIPHTVSQDERQLCFAGTDDVRADDIGYGPHTFDLKAAVQGCDKNQPIILLAHQPLAAKKALDTGVRIDLILSGHTHGGQMFPFMLGAYFTNPFFAGLYKVPGRDTHVYVNTGTQYWGIPMRILTSMEITTITLQPL